MPQTEGEGEEIRPGLRRRCTGPSPDNENDGVRAGAGARSEEWELSDLRLKAEHAVEKLSQAVGATGIDAAEDMELRQQLSQLNIPQSQSPTRPQAEGTGGASKSSTDTSAPAPARSRKSNLYSPYPPNLPLALLRLMESYIVGLAEVPKEEGGWAEAKRERGLTLIKSLTQHLGHAERLSSSKTTFPTSTSHVQCCADLLVRSPTSSPNDTPNGLVTDLPRCDPTLTHVRSERLDIGCYVCDCWMVLPRLRSASSRCRRGIWSIR